MGAGGYRPALIGRMHSVGPDQLHGYAERLVGDHGPNQMGGSGNSRGEYGGMFASLRAVSMIVAPAVYGEAYRRAAGAAAAGGSYGPMIGLPWFLMAIIASALEISRALCGFFATPPSFAARCLCTAL